MFLNHIEPALPEAGLTVSSYDPSGKADNAVEICSGACAAHPAAETDRKSAIAGKIRQGYALEINDIIMPSEYVDNAAQVFIQHN
jgi:hypothetical protein